MSKPLAASLATTAGRGSALFLVAAGYGVGLGLTSVARGMGVLFVGQMFYVRHKAAMISADGVYRRQPPQRSRLSSKLLWPI